MQFSEYAFFLTGCDNVCLNVIFYMFLLQYDKDSTVFFLQSSRSMKRKIGKYL